MRARVCTQVSTELRVLTVLGVQLDVLGAPYLFDAEESGDHVLVPCVPCCLRPSGLRVLLPVVLIRRNDDFAVLLG